jgi:hypothetical protein
MDCLIVQNNPSIRLIKAFDKSGVYSKSPKVADAMIEAQYSISQLSRLALLGFFELSFSASYLRVFAFAVFATPGSRHKAGRTLCA